MKGYVHLEDGIWNIERICSGIQFSKYCWVIICLLTDGVVSDSLLDLEEPSPKVQYVREDGSVIPEDELQELSPVNLLAAAVNVVDRDEPDEPTGSGNSVDHDPGNRLNLLIC